MVGDITTLLRGKTLLVPFPAKKRLNYELPYFRGAVEKALGDVKSLT